MQEYKDWDGNLLPDPAPRIHNIHIGDIIKTKHKSIEEPLETRGRGQHRFISETREYEVIAVYPRTIKTRDRKTGFTRCFSYGDLLTMGIEHQGAEVEDMRKRKMKTIEKKILPQYFQAVREEKKNFELRKDEDDVQPGDVLILMEWENGEYTGRTEVRRIRYVLRDVPEYGLMQGYCIIGW